MRKLTDRISALLMSMLGICFAVYAVWSYSLTDPNLVFTSWQPYWQAQQWLWQYVYADSAVQTIVYVAVVSLAWVLYLSLLYILQREHSQTQMNRTRWLTIATIVAPAVFAYNALSHDIFNYIFNARMVIQYGVDPHVHTALEFFTDPWVRFMHNTHTPAPYGYGWTAISLVPYLFGVGKFTLTWVLFKVFAVISYIGLAWSVQWLAVQVRKQPLSWFEAAALFLNPLLVIEVLGNAHNDAWMIVPAMLAVGIAMAWGTKRIGWLVALMSFSILVKYATVVLLPVLLVLLYAENVWERWRSRLMTRIPLGIVFTVGERLIGSTVRRNVFGFVAAACAALLLLPLLSSRSQQFHPWYLLWSLAWLPFVSIRFIRVFLLSFSISSTFRYVPWLSSGGFTQSTVAEQIGITWLGGILLMLTWYVWSTLRIRRQSTGLIRI